MKRRRNRKISFAQVIIAFFAVLCVAGFATFNSISMASAASVSGFTVSGLSASYDNGTWSSTGNNLQGSATGTAKTKCDSATSQTSTLTITNTKSVEGQLSFTYAAPSGAASGYVQINGTKVTAAGSVSNYTISSGGTYKIVIYSGDAGANTKSISISNISFVSEATVTATFAAPNPSNGGTYTVNGIDYASLTENPMTYSTSSTTITVKATAASGFNFFGWLDGNGKLYSDLVQTNVNLDVNYTLYPMFYASNEAVYLIKEASVYKNTLASAITTLNSNSSYKTLVLVSSSGKVPAGDYTIASNKTLLIPYEATNSVPSTLNTADKAAQAASGTPSAFRTLTLLSGVTLTVNGTIYVNAKVNSHNNNWSGATIGSYGYLKMSSGSVIDLYGKIYCWGYISHGGTIYAHSGSETYESFQIGDMRGGTALSSLRNNSKKVFPLSQYYIQNIEAKTEYEYGASSIARGTVTISGSTSSPSVTVVGTGSSSLFQISSGGKFIKEYNPSVDRMYYEVYGNASLNSISLNVYISISSSDYVLPLMANTTIKIKTGTTTAKQDLCLVPGGEVEIDYGATFEVASGKNIYVYDRDEFVGKGFVFSNTDFVRSFYQPDRTTTFTSAKMVDASIDVNGKILLTGNMFTTTGGANIFTSQMTGEIVFNSNVPASKDTYQATQSGSSISYKTIATTTLRLKNGSQGSKDYTATAGTTSGNKFIFNEETDEWEKYVAPTYINVSLYDSLNVSVVYSVDNFKSGANFTFPTIDQIEMDDEEHFKFWIDDENNIYMPGSVHVLNGSEGQTVSFKAFLGGWLNYSYYEYENSSTDPVTGLYTIGSDSNRDSKTIVISGSELYHIPYSSTCYFGDNGELDMDGEILGTDYSQYKIVLNNVDSNRYLIKYGIVQLNYGLYRNLSGDYYYFGESNYAYKNVIAYISDVKDYDLEPGYYRFNSDGVLSELSITKPLPTSIHDDVAYVVYESESSPNNIVADNYGLFALSDGKLYYAGSNGALIKNATFFVADDMINGCFIGDEDVTEGLYYFDNNGCMYDTHLNLITNGGQA